MANSRRMFLAVGVAVVIARPCVAQWDLSKMVTRTSRGAVFHAQPVPSKLINAWPPALEAEFQKRAERVIAAQARDIKGGVNTYFENEKRSYGFLMAHVLGGRHEQALKDLQARDHQHEQWHRETAGIDYYACFTLKHQIRKYFYFGDLLESDYRRRMFDGAKRWTAKDPLRRPHYAHTGPKEGWGPDARNSWVDVRSTENLWLMRTTSVYLMAEETGNEATRQRYRQHLLNYTKTLYRIGIGEWDSENYHGHSIGPLLNLYDFARDESVQAAAKACLDFYAIAGAVKYYRGGFNGPTKRDYNHPQPFGGSAANSLWMWYGNHPSGKNDHWESDEVHQITSAYRPPLAAVKLARKQFPRPVEIFAAKPAYDATTQFRHDSQPEHLETQYIGHTFQMGTLTSGTSEDGGDVNGFKILAFDETDGAIALHAVPGSNPSLPGSPMYKRGVVAGRNRVAQQENLALWLVKDGTAPWLWVIPESVEVSVRKDVTFLKCDRTWVAVRTLGGTALKLDPELSKRLTEDRKNRFVDHKVLSAKGRAEGWCGLAVEVGERQTHGSFDQFVRAVLSADVDTTELSAGVARYKSSDGKWLGIHWNNDPLQLGVWRNGVRRDLATAAVYDSPVIQAGWGTGTLSVSLPDAKFRCQVDDDGAVVFGTP
ncbi:MAG: hypothetical protein NXI04_23680 [Planctomycetaceae bacterium]|nr:hypothetical protein [Planctomycetaceae bacterium]